MYSNIFQPFLTKMQFSFICQLLCFVSTQKLSWASKSSFWTWASLRFTLHLLKLYRLQISSEQLPLLVLAACLMIKFLATIFIRPFTKTKIDFWIRLLDTLVNLLMENMWSKEVCHRRAATICSKYIWYKIVPSYFSFAEIDQESCVGSAGTVLYRSDMWCP